mmetsp:Transcript_19985/g.24233  ORF Transcript_19985/g.24233 Transcript_19985/m.24233 type:complete len:112 (-) Transcript_19985:745-1080(-)
MCAVLGRINVRRKNCAGAKLWQVSFDKNRNARLDVSHSCCRRKRTIHPKFKDNDNMANEKSANKNFEEPRAKHKQIFIQKARKTIIWKMRKAQTRSLKNQEQNKSKLFIQK